jgi:hypothetical protein
MTRLARFTPPANIVDFPNDDGKQQKLQAEWSTNIERWTQLAILGNPWDVLYDNDRSGYYDPTKTDVDKVTGPVPITWNAFPARIKHYFSGSSSQEQWRMADEGNLPDIPDLQDPHKMVPYTPAGARGWQDEYCEWSVTRNKDGKIVRVDCTCENSEYWLTLWRVDPERVRALYQELVGHPVNLDDLTLKDKDGKVVLDPSTGAPAYDPLNKFNNSTTNGAVHLVSGPNTLGAEIYLAAAATLMREGHDDSDPDDLIKCAKYGREFRNSDPNIGASVYGYAAGGLRMTLTDPVGLYMSIPDASKITLNNETVKNCFRILRGTDVQGRGLHIRFELPDEPAYRGLTLSDLKVNNNPVLYGAQFVELITMTLYGEGFGPFTPRDAQPCVADSPKPAPMVQVFLPTPIYEYQFKDRSLQVALTPRVTLPATDGSTKPVSFTLYASHMEKNATLNFSMPGLSVTPRWDTYVTDTDTATVEVDVIATAFARLGDVSLQIVNPDGNHGPPMPSVLEIVDRPRPRGVAADQSAAPDAVKQASQGAVRTGKSRTHRR